MKLRRNHAIYATSLVASLVLWAAISFAQTQTTSNSHSQSNGGQASSSASASSRSQAGGSQWFNGGAGGGTNGGNTGGTSGSVVKGNFVIVEWSPNLQARATSQDLANHQNYLRTYGTQYGVLLEGAVGGDEPGRMAIMQSNAQQARELAANSPLVLQRLATYVIKPYAVDYSRLGIINAANDLPKNQSESTNSQTSQQTSQSTQTSQSGGGKSGG